MSNSTCPSTSNTLSFEKEGVPTAIGVGCGVVAAFVLANIFVYWKFIKKDKYGYNKCTEVDTVEPGWVPVPSSRLKAKGHLNVLWFQKNAWINVISIFVEAIQLSAFAFAPSIPWSNGGNSGIRLHLESIFNAFLIQWGDELYKLLFWIIFAIGAGLVYIIIPVSGFCMVMCKAFVRSYHHPERDEPELVESTITLYRVVTGLAMLMDAFGLTIMTVLFTPLNCTYYLDSPPTLDIEPSIICWQGQHLIYAWCSIIVIVPLFTWAVIIQITDPEVGMSVCFNCFCDEQGRYGERDGREILTHYKWAYFATQLKVVIAAANAYFSHHQYIRLVVMILCDFLIFVLAMRVKVNQYFMHNVLRRITIAASLWTVGCAFVALLICDADNWASFFIWTGGLLVTSVVGILILRWASRTNDDDSGMVSSDGDDRQIQRYLAPKEVDYSSVDELYDPLVAT